MKKHLVLSLAMLFSIAVVSLLVYGIRTYDEPGLTDPAASWPAMPLTVCVERGDTDLVIEVKDTVNTRLGFAALVVDPGGPVAVTDCDITVRMGVAVEVGKDEAGGNYTLERRGDTYHHCAVETANTGTTELELLVLEHEFGHCLGLAHDDFDASIMRRVQKPWSGKGFPAEITDWDRDLLRKKYLH